MIVTSRSKKLALQMRVVFGILGMKAEETSILLPVFHLHFSSELLDKATEDAALMYSVLGLCSFSATVQSSS